MPQLLPDLDKLKPAAVQRWIDAALTRATALRELDDRLHPPVEDARAMETARLLRQAWSDSAEEAEQILDRVRALAESDHPIDGNAELARAIARARAMLQLTPEAIALRRQQVERGEVRSVEEVRRELCLEHRG